jgi:hypothetical protein
MSHTHNAYWYLQKDIKKTPFGLADHPKRYIGAIGDI